MDSADSILMLYSYTGFPDRSLIIFDKTSGCSPGNELKSSSMTSDIPSSRTTEKLEAGIKDMNMTSTRPSSEKGEGSRGENLGKEGKLLSEAHAVSDETGSTVDRDSRVKMNVMSGLSIVLTLMSILVAFR